MGAKNSITEARKKRHGHLTFKLGEGQEFLGPLEVLALLPHNPCLTIQEPTAQNGSGQRITASIITEQTHRDSQARSCLYPRSHAEWNGNRGTGSYISLGFWGAALCAYKSRRTDGYQWVPEPRLSLTGLSCAAVCCDCGGAGRWKGSHRESLICPDS